MDDKLKELIGKISETFIKYGIKSVTMDDLARNLHVSKKTLYQYFDDKQDLVKTCLKHHIDVDMCEIKAISENRVNAIDEMYSMGKAVSHRASQIHPSIFYDLEKYYPEAWDLFNDYRKGQIYETIKDNIERGMAEGLYRSDLNVDVIAGIYVLRIDDLTNQEIFPSDKYPFGDLYLEVMRYHIRGMASDKGIEYLKQLVEQERNNQS